MGEDSGALAFQEQQAVNDQKKSERASKKREVVCGDWQRLRKRKPCSMR